MKLTFIGTSHGVPEIGRQCSCTLLETQGKHYLIDVGCDANRALTDLQIPFSSLQAVLITHSDGDHIGGLPMLCDLINWYYKDCNPRLLLPNENCIEKLKAWVACMSILRPLSFDTVKTGTCYRDPRVKVTAFPTLHTPDSHAFLIEAEGKRLLFTGDLKDPREDFPPVSYLDAAICEAAHFDVRLYPSVLKEKEIKTIYVNHHFGENILRIFCRLPHGKQATC